MQVDSVALTNKHAAEVVASFVWATTVKSFMFIFILRNYGFSTGIWKLGKQVGHLFKESKSQGRLKFSFGLTFPFSRFVLVNCMYICAADLTEDFKDGDQRMQFYRMDCLDSFRSEMICPLESLKFYFKRYLKYTCVVCTACLQMSGVKPLVQDFTMHSLNGSSSPPPFLTNHNFYLLGKDCNAE